MFLFNEINNQLIIYFSNMGKDVGQPKEERYAQIEEWFRAFNCWPLPFVTIVCVIVEIAVFASLLNRTGIPALDK